MGRINLGRVILGGLVAGIVIDLFEGVLNGVILNQQWADAMAALGRSGTLSMKQLIAFNVWGLAAGILMIGLYAAMRPRLGAGAKTAICAGLMIWATAYALGSAASIFLHLFPLGLMATGLAVGLVETIIAGMAGAYLYKEGSAEGLKSSAARA
jgi:uncharacterized membrane protein YcfT